VRTYVKFLGDCQWSGGGSCNQRSSIQVQSFDDRCKL